MADERNWAGNIVFSARRVLRPSSVEQLRTMVAASRGIRPLGSRHSFSGIADTPGDLIETTGLPTVLEFDEDAGTVRVDAGVRYGDLAPRLEAAGLALQNMASLPHITVGGSIATGTHGSGDANPTLSAAVAGLEFITADGGVERLRRGDPGFDGAVVSLGALGVVVAVELDVVPSFRMRQERYTGLGWETVLGRFDELTGTGYSVSMFTRWTGDTFGDLWLKTVADEVPERVGDARRATVAATPTGDEPSNATQQGGVEGPWHERLPHFRPEFTPSNGDELQTEYLVPREFAVEAVGRVRELGYRIEPHLLVSELRTMAADGLWLSGAGGRAAVGIHFTWRNRPTEVGALLPAIEERILELGARPHWGKLSATRDLAPRYPRIEDFRALADRYDPRGKFRNRWLDERLFR